MWEYLSLKKKMMNINGGDITSAIKHNSDKLYSNDFKCDESYRLAILIEPNKEPVNLDVREINNNNSVFKKNFLLMPNTVIATGSYITITKDGISKTYIVKEYEDNQVSPFVKAEYCNRGLKYKGLNREPIPCRVYNDGYGVKTTTDNDINRQLSKKTNIDIQINEYTKAIEPNKRYIFNNSKHSIYKVISINDTFTDGYMTLTCENDTMVAEDDLENNIAWNEDNPITPPIDPATYEIIGSDTIKVNTIQEYKIQPHKIDILFKVLPLEYAEITGVSDGEVFVKGLVKDENIMLICEDLNGVSLAEKFIGVVR